MDYEDWYLETRVESAMQPVGGAAADSAVLAGHVPCPRLPVRIVLRRDSLVSLSRLPASTGKRQSSTHDLCVYVLYPHRSQFVILTNLFESGVPMRPSPILLTFVCLLPLSLFSITPARGDDPLTEFTIAFEWAATPSLTVSKGPGHTYQISLAVDSLPSKHLPGLLAKLDGPDAPTIAAVRMSQRGTSGFIAHTAITFEPIHKATVGAVLKHLTDLLNMKEITIDANVFEGKRTANLPTSYGQTNQPRLAG